LDDFAFVLGCGVKIPRRTFGHLKNLGIQREAAAHGGEAAGHQKIGLETLAQLDKRLSLSGGSGSGQGLVHRGLVDYGEADLRSKAAGKHVPDAGGEIAHVLGGIGLEGQKGYAPGLGRPDRRQHKMHGEEQCGEQERNCAVGVFEHDRFPY